VPQAKKSTLDRFSTKRRLGEGYRGIADPGHLQDATAARPALDQAEPACAPFAHGRAVPERIVLPLGSLCWSTARRCHSIQPDMWTGRRLP
jgi:hypothetical protein